MSLRLRGFWRISFFLCFIDGFRDCTRKSKRISRVNGLTADVCLISLRAGCAVYSCECDIHAADFNGCLAVSSWVFTDASVTSAGVSTGVSVLTGGSFGWSGWAALYLSAALWIFA